MSSFLKKTNLKEALSQKFYQIFFVKHNKLIDFIAILLIACFTNVLINEVDIYFPKTSFWKSIDWMLLFKIVVLFLISTISYFFSSTINEIKINTQIKLEKDFGKNLEQPQTIDEAILNEIRNNSFSYLCLCLLFIAILFIALIIIVILN